MGEIIVGPGAPQLFTASKTFTFTGAASLGAIGTFPIFTVTGGIVAVQLFAGRVTTSLVGTGATISLGATGAATAFIGATAITNFVTGTPIFIAGTAAVSGAIAVPSATIYTVVGANIIGTVATAAVTAGVMEFDLLWAPLSPGSTLQ